MDEEINERSPGHSQRSWLIHTGDRKESLVEKHRLYLEGQREAEGGEKSFRDHFVGEM